jgi:hypothetical protein
METDLEIVATLPPVRSSVDPKVEGDDDTVSKEKERIRKYQEFLLTVLHIDIKKGIIPAKATPVQTLPTMTNGEVDGKSYKYRERSSCSN